MGDQGPQQGENHKITIEVSGPLTKEQFEAYKAALRECIQHFKDKPYGCRVRETTIERSR
jgi:mannose/cellobiose epimerase-like protein (N-acyl-D-glucosamine 2-epimerase family)